MPSRSVMVSLYHTVFTNLNVEQLHKHVTAQNSNILFCQTYKKSAEDRHANFININILPKVANIYYHFSFLNSSRIYAGL